MVIPEGTGPRLAGDHMAADSCKDLFRYKLAGDNGHYRFESVKFVGENGCSSPELARMAAMLEGKWLDEIDVDAITRLECRQGRALGCPREIAKMVLEIREVLLGPTVS